MKLVEITTQPDNVASSRVIEKNGGLSLVEYQEPQEYGGKVGPRYLVKLL
jgi:predicted acetyltransferase